jgi:hypothetical protein
MIRKTVIAAAAGAVVLAGGAAAVAATTSSGGGATYHGCERTSNNREIFDVYSTKTPKCPSGAWQITFNQKGQTGPQGASGASAPVSEVDNGAEFATSTSPSLGDTSASAATYADAGALQDIGTVGQLSAAALAFTGGSGLAENIWIGDGPEASTPGIYKLSDVDFCYGLGASGDTSFQMQSGCGTYAGQTLSVSQIAADFPASLEAYAWVGVVSSGSAVPATTVSTIDGKTVNLSVGIGASGSVLTPYVSPSS